MKYRTQRIADSEFGVEIVELIIEGCDTTFYFIDEEEAQKFMEKINSKEELEELLKDFYS